MRKVCFKRIGLVGIGLIGASFALAVRERKMVEEIWCYSETGKSSARAVELGIADKNVNDLSRLASECDFILVSTPVLSIPGIMKEIATQVGESTTVTDGGSVKNFSEEVHGYFKHKNFIGSHPVAGTEKSGPDAGFASLFNGSYCIITPVEGSDESRLDLVKTVWENIGMKIFIMTPDEHDSVMAGVSHMPHAVAFSLVDSLSGKECRNINITEFAGGGFRDFTRIARSDSSMWADIFLSNNKNIIEYLESFEESLKSLKSLLQMAKRDDIAIFLERNKRTLLGSEKK